MLNTVFTIPTRLRRASIAAAALLTLAGLAVSAPPAGACVYQAAAGCGGPTGPYNTTTSVSSSASPSITGHTVSFSVTVTGGLTSGPVGTVQLLVDGTPQGNPVGLTRGGSGTVASTATISASQIPVGSHTIEVDFSDSSGAYSPSSATTQQIVQLAGSSTTLSTGTGNLTVGQTPTFSAQVSGDDGVVPSGSLSFTVDSDGQRTAELDPAGIATFTTTPLAAGTHTILAVYGGDATHDRSSASYVVHVSAPTPANPPAQNGSGSAPAGNQGSTTTTTTTTTPTTGSGPNAHGSIAAVKPAVTIAVTHLTGRAAARISGTVSSGGAATVWQIQRQIVRRDRAGHRVISWQILRSGTVAATGSARFSVVYASMPGARLTVRVLARNSAGVLATHPTAVTF